MEDGIEQKDVGRRKVVQVVQVGSVGEGSKEVRKDEREENLNLRSKEERMVDALALKDDEGREKLR